MPDHALIVAYGYVIITREAFLNMTTMDEERLNAQTLDELQTRARLRPGSHVVYDPDDNGDGWLIVGSLDQVIAETAGMIREMLL